MGEQARGLFHHSDFTATIRLSAELFAVECRDLILQGRLVLKLTSSEGVAIWSRAAIGDHAMQSLEVDWFERGCELEAHGDCAAAANAYQRALASSPDCAETHFNLANALRECQQHRRAKSHFLAALQIDPCFAEAWYNLADLHDTLGELCDAARCLRRALQIDPLYADAHFNLADCCERLNLYAQAARHWRQYLTLDPRSEWARDARQGIARCMGFANS
jgi:tetratricopeptide (TPR) repeat protein